MKNKRNLFIIVFIVAIALVCGGMVIYRLLQDENQLTVTEKKYITDHGSNLISVNVINDSNVFGSAGKGVYYSFLQDFETNNNLSFNIVTASMNNEQTGLSLTNGLTVPEGASVFYTDHYVLVGKTYASISSPAAISGTIGILNSDTDLFNSRLKGYSMTYKNYENRTALEEGLHKDEVAYILIPMIEYLDTTLSNLYSIDYHFSDIKNYYYMNYSDDEILSSILKKYYNVWIEESFNSLFNAHEYSLFTNKLKITEKELDIINNKVYNYGFINDEPYQIKSSGAYGGIVNMYLSNFTGFSGITFDYKSYSNFNKFTKALSAGKIDLFFNNYDLTTSMTKLDSLYNLDISFIMNNADKRVFNTFDSIKNETIYVEENSLIKSYLESNKVNVKTYKKQKELKKLVKNNEIIAMDSANYLVLDVDLDLSVNERFKISTGSTYNFVSGNDTMFNRLFTYYTSTIDKNEIVYTGIDNYEHTIKSGTIIYKIAKYAFVLVIGIIIIAFVIYKFGRKVHIKKKIKSADKMKYIDMMTSLKNRNFLTENLSIWNQNTIYPQAIVVVDLNGIQELNDSYGYSEGDKQIQAAANALIKTQLDNSEIMRTDGNEFTVYLVGYSEKQIISYIKKLNKEFKNLPHDKNAAIGFSMIEDDLKLIDDAINEATEKMRANKELQQGGEDENKA